MAIEKKPGFKIKGWLLVSERGRALMPDISVFQAYWEEYGVELSMRNNIEGAINKIYGYPLCRERTVSRQALYCELEKVVQAREDWKKLKEKTSKAEKEKRKISKLTEIEKYRIETSQIITKRILKHDMRSRCRSHK